MRLSLDKIVINLKYPHGKMNLEEIHKVLCLEPDTKMIGDFKFYDSTFTYKNKAHISLNPKINDKDNFPEDSLRMEFNPNKLELGELGWLLSMLPKREFIQYNRVDFAIDIKKNLLPQFFFDKNKKHQHYYFCGADCETAYIGSQLSDIQYRIYDKRKEILKNEKLLHETQEILVKEFNEYFLQNFGFDVKCPLYRVEVQLRKQVLNKLDKNFWAGLCYYECPDFSPDAKIKTNHMFFLAYSQLYGVQSALKLIEPHRRLPYQNLFKIVMFDDFYHDSIEQFKVYDSKIKQLIGTDIYE